MLGFNVMVGIDYVAYQVLEFMDVLDVFTTHFLHKLIGKKLGPNLSQMRKDLIVSLIGKRCQPVQVSCTFVDR